MVEVERGQVGYDLETLGSRWRWSRGKVERFISILESTTKLSKSQFADLVSDLQRWAAETFNINLPSPGEQTDLDL